ncbi:MAG: hypothetical protein ABDH49_01835 [Candidatus Hydrothermales bacterium]
MKEEKIFVNVLETDYENSFSLSYPNWRFKFEKVLEEIEKGNIRYIHTGASASFFLRFYKENSSEELKLNLLLRLKKIGINPFYYFIPPNLLEAHSLIKNLKIVYDELKESFSGEKVLYLPIISKLPSGLFYLLKGFDIDLLVSKIPLKKHFVITKDFENEIKIMNVSCDSKNVFIEPYPQKDEIKNSLFSLEEITSTIPEKGDFFEFNSDIKVKKNYPYFKKLEDLIFKCGVLNTILNVYKVIPSDYFIKEKNKNFLKLFNSDNTELIKEEIKELKIYIKTVTEDFIEEKEGYLIFNVLPFKREYYRIIKNKLFRAEVESLSFSELKEEKSVFQEVDFKIYERGNLKFYDLYIYPKLIGEKGEIKGGIYEEELFKENFIKTNSKIKWDKKIFLFSTSFLPHDESLKLKGKLININRCEILIYSEKNFKVYTFAPFVKEEITTKKIYSGYLIIEGEKTYFLKTIPGTILERKNGIIKLVFDKNVELEIKKISEFTVKEFLKFKYKPILFKGKLKKKLNPLFEIKNDNVNFLSLDLNENTLFIYLYSQDNESIKLLFKEKTGEAFLFDLKAKRKLDKLVIKERWVITPSQRGLFCIGIDITKMPLYIF